MSTEVLAELVRVLLLTTAERNKALQRASCSTLCELIEAGDTCLFPYVVPICLAVAAAFGHYQLISVQLLYDLIGTISRCFGNAMANEEVLSLVVPPLMAHLERYALPDDPCSIPLLDCFISLIRAAGPALNSIATTLIGRACTMLHASISAAQQHVEAARTANVAVVFFDGYGFLVTGLELINALMVALGPAFDHLLAACEAAAATATPGTVQPSRSFILEAVMACAQLPTEIGFEEGDARFTAFALVGDMASFAPTLVYPILAPTGASPGTPGVASSMVQMMVLSMSPDDANLDYLNAKTVNNALWGTGEVAMQLMRAGAGGSEIFCANMPSPPWWGNAVQLIGPSVAHVQSNAAAASVPAIDAMLTALTLLLQKDHSQLEPTMLENFAITMGRIALVDSLAPRVAAYFHLIIIPWVRCCRRIEMIDEKLHAFQGLMAMIEANPAALAQHGGEGFCQVCKRKSLQQQTATITPATKKKRQRSTLFCCCCWLIPATHTSLSLVLVLLSSSLLLTSLLVFFLHRLQLASQRGTQRT